MDLSYFNPRSQNEPDFLANFVARHTTLGFLLRQLRLAQAAQPARHHLIVAPRGYGKTSLLRRIAVAVRTEGDLSQRFIALSFREEQHNVISLDVFWRNCLQSLLEVREDEQATEIELDQIEEAWSAHAPRQGLKREDQDGEPAWQEFRGRCAQLGRRPLLLIDNLDALLAGLDMNHQWGLRRILQSDDGPLLIAAASRYPESTHDAQAAFYEFFRVQTLDKLGDEEVMQCLRALATHRGEGGRAVLQLLDQDPGRVSALNTLAGGNPRTLNVLYGVLESHMSADVLSQLSAMLDTFTGWYQARTEELPMQARAVFDALALNWDPMSAARLGEVTGLDTTAVSSQISRLEKAGYVEAVALNRRGKGRNGYQVGERFFNIWYLMRNGPRRARQSIRFLTVFLQSCFSGAERRTMGYRLLGESQADPGYALALASSMRTGSLRQQLLEHAQLQSERMGQSEHYGAAIEELRRLDNRKEPPRQDAPSARTEQTIEELDRVINQFGDAIEPTMRERVAKALFNKGFRLGQLGRGEQAIEAYDELLRRYADAPEPAMREQVARALVNKGFRLGELGRGEQEIEAYDELVRRYADAAEPALRERVARALFNKGFRLGELGRGEQAIEVYDELLRRYADAAEPALRERVARALFNKGFELGELGRGEQAIEVYDELLRRYADAAEPALREQVGRALVNKGFRLGELGRGEQEIEAYDELLRRYADAAEPALREQVARALFNKGVTLGQLGRGEQAIEVYDELVRRYADAAEPALRERVARALFNKGFRLGELGRGEQAIEVYDELLGRYADAAEPALREQVGRALVNKGFRLGELGRGEQEIEAYDELLRRYADAAEPALREQVARALFNKGVTLGQLGRGEQAIEVYDELVRRYADAAEPALRERVARALFNKGLKTGQLGRGEQAIEVYDELHRRYADAAEPALRERVARALVNKGFRLGELGRGEQAIEVYDELLRRYADAAEPALREQVARALGSKGYRLGELGRGEEAETALRQALVLEPGALGGWIWNGLGNLLLDTIGNPLAALAAYEAGLSGSPAADAQAGLHANRAYALALHGGDTAQAEAHAQQAMADGKSISGAGRYLLAALSCLRKPAATRWEEMFGQIGKAVDCEDGTLWSAYLDDLQRLLWFVVAEGQGPALRRWMEEAQYPLRYAPLYHALLAVLDGEDHLLRINPETRQPAARIHQGIARRLKLYPPDGNKPEGRRRG